MTVLSRQEQDFENQISPSVTPDLDFIDGMKSSADEALRAAPTASIFRGIQNVFDTSEKMDPLRANEQFGLMDEYAFKEGDEVTIDRAKAVSDDMHRIKLNDFITNTVNEESPILGRVTQFASSISAGFVDPVLMASNIAGGAIVGSIASRIATSSRGIGAISRMSPNLGKVANRMYAEGVQKTFTDVLVREGAENFVSSVLEESVNFAGIGEERLARNVTAQESLVNIAAGTFLGGALGTVISSDGRKAITRSFGRKYGDKAGEFLTTHTQMSTIEAQMGIEKGTLENQISNLETFQPKPWQPEPYVFTPKMNDTMSGQKLYIPINEDGSVHSISHRGSGTVLTDNHTQAYNSGAKVMEIDASQTNLMRDLDIISPDGAPTPLGKKMFSDISDDIIRFTDAERLSKGIYLLKNPDLDLDEAPLLVGTQLKKELQDLFQGKGIEDSLEVLDRLTTMTNSKLNPYRKLDYILEENGFDGYQFVGKNFSEEPSYNGVYVREMSAKKLAKKQDLDSPIPTPEAKAAFNKQYEGLMKDYHDSMSKQMNQSLLNQPAPELPTRSADAPPAPNERVSAVVNTDDKKLALDDLLRQYEEKLATQGEKVDVVTKQQLETLKKLTGPEDTQKLIDADTDKIAKFLACELGIE